MNEVNTEIHQISTEIVALSEQLKALVTQISEMKSDIKEIKSEQANKINRLEVEVALLKDKVERLDWYYKLVMGLSISGIAGAILSLIFKN